MTDVLARLKKEHLDLKDNFEKLSKALENRELLSKLPQAQISLMKTQKGLQGQLITVLAQRIALVEKASTLAPQDATRAQPVKQPQVVQAKAEPVEAAPAVKKTTRTKKKADTTESDTVE